MTRDRIGMEMNESKKLAFKALHLGEKNLKVRSERNGKAREVFQDRTMNHSGFTGTEPIP